MWISNIISNRETIIEQFISKGDTDLKLLLKAGLPITTKLQNIKNSIAEKFNDSICAIDWDEFFLYFPKEIEVKEIKNEISKIFQKNNLKARSSYIEIRNDNTSDDILEKCNKLDSITWKMNKIIENNGELGEIKEYKKLEELKELKKLKEYKNWIDPEKYCLINRELILKILKQKEDSLINFFELYDIDIIIENIKTTVSTIFDDNSYTIIYK